MSADLVTISAKEAESVLWRVMSRHLVPMLTSSPGIGKSSIAKQIAKRQNLKVLDLRLSQCDPTDMNGFPYIFECKTKAGYVPMQTFPMEGDEIPEGYDGWLLLLDEMNSAPRSVQAAAYKIVLDREVGLQKMHDKVFMMAAGNLKSDGAIVNDLSTAMQSRMIHFQLQVDFDSWKTWAYKNNIDFRIVSYLTYQRDSLMKFDKNHSDKTFACPRTWEFLHTLIHDIPVLQRETDLALVAGTVGLGEANGLLGFCDIYQTLPTIEQIMKDPTGFTYPTEKATEYALVGLIAKHFTVDTAPVLMKAIDRMELEFQLITLSDIVQSTPTMVSSVSPVREWAMKHGKHFAD